MGQREHTFPSCLPIRFRSIRPASAPSSCCRSLPKNMSVMCSSYNTALGTTPFPWLLHQHRTPACGPAPSDWQPQHTRSPCIASSARACRDQKQSCSGRPASRECSGGLRLHCPCRARWRAQQRAPVYAAQARKCGAIGDAYIAVGTDRRTLRASIFARSTERLRKEET